MWALVVLFLSGPIIEQKFFFFTGDECQEGLENFPRENVKQIECKFIETDRN